MTVSLILKLSVNCVEGVIVDIKQVEQLLQDDSLHLPNVTINNKDKSANDYVGQGNIYNLIKTL